MQEFSLNLLCRGQTHRLAATLDSLKTQDGSFEVLLLDGEGEKEKLQLLAHRYEGLCIRIETVEGKSLAEMMNQGVALSQGKYIQFLEPGDRYISQYGLSFLKELVEKERPPFVTAQGLSRQASSEWLSRELILEMGGFDSRFSMRPLFDLLCRCEKKGVAPLFCNRVFVDTTLDSLPFFRETFRILYRNFGLSRTVSWLFRKRREIYDRFCAWLKSAFWEESAP